MSVCEFLYLWFITNKNIIVHGLWDVVDVELQVGSFRHVNEAHTSPRWTAIQWERPRYHRHALTHTYMSLINVE